MSCGLKYTAFNTKAEAQLAMKKVNGAFAVSRVTNSRLLYYIISKEGDTYYINYKDGRTTNPNFTGAMNSLYGHLVIGESTYDYFIDELIPYNPPVPNPSLILGEIIFGSLG